MPKTPKLKVYSTSVGFYDALVAAPSQKAALKAWGTTTDLFGAGRASVVDDPDLQAEALAQPGKVVKRARGDEAAMLDFEAPSTPEPQSELAPKPKVKQPSRSKPKPAKSTPPPEPPDRTKLDRAERDLADAEREIAAEEATLAKQRDDLEHREREVRRAADKRLTDLRLAKGRAEAAYDRAAHESALTPK